MFVWNNLIYYRIILTSALAVKLKKALKVKAWSGTEALEF